MSDKKYEIELIPEDDPRVQAALAKLSKSTDSAATELERLGITVDPRPDSLSEREG